ncbi:ABC transporter substrate-binding protein [Chitinimonas naiadis]
MDKPRPLGSIALSIASLENPFYVALVKGAEAKARNINPSVKLTTLANEYSADRQIAHIQQLIAQRVDLILITAADRRKIADTVAAARAAGIIVVAVDVEADGADAYVRTDSRQAGELACTFLANALKGQGSLIMQNGPQISSVTDRIAGCHDALHHYPGIKVLSDTEDGKGSRWGGMQLMLAHLKRFPTVDAVFTVNDRQAIGADMAARRMGKRQLLIASVDGAPDIEQALKSDSLIRASASQDPYQMADRAVLVGYELLQGKRPAKATLLMPTSLVTRDNVMQYRGWSWGGR